MMRICVKCAVKLHHSHDQCPRCRRQTVMLGDSGLHSTELLMLADIETVHAVHIAELEERVTALERGWG